MKSIVIMWAFVIGLLSCQPSFANSSTIMVKAEEGFRATPYMGSRGYVHIGYGYKLHKVKGLDSDQFLLVISEEVASLMLESRLQKINARLSHGRHGKTFQKLNQARQDVLVSMSYQMGYDGLMSFKRMWSALKAGNPESATDEALDSIWADQTPLRAHRHAYTLLTGVPYDY